MLSSSAFQLLFTDRSLYLLPFGFSVAVVHELVIDTLDNIHWSKGMKEGKFTPIYFSLY